jgi:GNAT superfamily N-acetyltransferase
MDQVEFRNLGRDGKQTILTRHLATKRIDNLLAAATGTPALPVPATPTGTWRIREFAPRDALGIARSAYRTYGYTYEPFIYYPEQITAMNARGELLSLVAVNEEDEVVGHIALKFRPDMPALAEVGVGLVIPEYRNRRIFDRLLEQIHARAVARGLTGLFSRPVTSHAVSQKFVEKFLHQVPVGILLGIFPDDVEFKKMTGKVRQKESAIIYYGMLRAAPARTVFLPPGCRDRVLAVFSSLNIPVITGAVDGAAAAGETELHSSTCEVLNVAELRVPVLGVNVLAEIDRVRRELCLRHIDVIYLYLDLEDPLAAAVGEACCRAGFLFAGLLPFAGCGRHTLILQYLNNLAIDYAAIRPFSPVARDLLSYVHSTGAPDGHGDANASAV